MKLTYNDNCHSFDCSMIFLNMKTCSVVPLPGRKPVCPFLSFDSTPVRILSITILPITLLTTDSSVIPRQFLHSFAFPFFGSLTISPFLHFLGVFDLVSPHYVYDLLDFSGSIVNVSFKQLRLYVVYSWRFSILQMPYGLLYFSLLTGSQRGRKKIRRASEWESERRDSASEASGTRGSL